VSAAESRSVPVLRRVRKDLSRKCAAMPPATILGASVRLVDDDAVPRWVTYELIHHHGPAMSALDVRAVRRLGRGIASWGDVDAFACLVAGPAWREGRLPDAEIHRWASSRDRWWRRAALVATVPLNSAARGGSGDAPRTLAVCRLLHGDRDDMVVKAMSWALRALSGRDRVAVEVYLEQHEEALAPRVLREVGSKLETGVKAPRRNPRGA
jgi:3-methyladenine DNA glycosylase AlkD